MEQKTSFLKKVTMKAGEKFTLSLIKKVGIGGLICTVIVGIGGVYWHQQKINEHGKIIEARARMIEVQAAKNNITLMDNEKIKEIVSETIGINGNSIEYRTIELTSTDNGGSFHPVYKVACRANNIKYSLSIDAVNGQVVKSKVSDG